MARLDARGRFHPDDVPDLRATIRDLQEAREPLDHPASVFGPWGELGSHAQKVLRRAVENDIKRTMDFFPQGGFWTGLVRGAWEFDRSLGEHPALRKLRKPLSRWANRLSGGPLNASDRLYRAFHTRSWKHGRRVLPKDLLAALGRSPQWLLADYVEGVEVDPRARGHFVDPGRNVVHGYMVGLDLVPTPKGICCIEANLQSGILDFEEDLFAGNPIVEGILEAGEAHGARRILWIEGHRLPLRTWMLSDLKEGSERSGIRTEILEDPCMPSRASPPEGVEVPHRWSFPPWVPNDTLVVRRNEFKVGPDYVINHKEPFIRGLIPALREANETRVHVLPMTRVPVEVPEPAGPGLPNLVYKYPDSLAGMGVFFLRARDTSHAIAMARELDRKSGEPAGLFQPFTCSHLLEGRRIYDVRTEVFISPLGTWYLCGFKREGAHPLPDHLPEGVVSTTGTFASNLSTGGAASEIMVEEEQELKDASLAVGEALRRTLDQTFQTRPPGQPRNR